MHTSSCFKSTLEEKSLTQCKCYANHVRLYCLGDNGKKKVSGLIHSAVLMEERIFHLQLAEPTSPEAAGLKFQLHTQIHTLNKHRPRMQMDTSPLTEELLGTSDCSPSREQDDAAGGLRSS